jgi:hypothetical protein
MITPPTPVASLRSRCDRSHRRSEGTGRTVVVEPQRNNVPMSTKLGQLPSDEELFAYAIIGWTLGIEVEHHDTGREGGRRELRGSFAPSARCRRVWANRSV